MNNIQSYTIPPPSAKIIAKGDSAASDQYFPLQDIAALQYFLADKFTPTVVLPDTSTHTANGTRKLPFPSTPISPENKTVVFDKLQHSIILLGQLCDNICQIILNKRNL